MTIQLRPTLVQFANGSQQTTAASVNPAWANIVDRPGNDSVGTNDAWHQSNVTNGFNNGFSGNCGYFNYGYESKLRLKNVQNTANTTLGNDWYMYYWIINCYDCNC